MKDYSVKVVSGVKKQAAPEPKTYKVMRTYLPVGEAGKQVKLPDDKFTQDMLNSGIIAEVKVVEPVEKKATKPRAKRNATKNK